MSVEKEQAQDPYAFLLNPNDYELISVVQFNETKKYPDIEPDKIIVTTIGEKIVKQYVFKLKNPKIEEFHQFSKK